jgi:hypothetical protein
LENLGSECEWGYVKEIERPDRILFAWQLTPEWKFDPDPARSTEVEVEAGATMRESVSSDGGWPELLQHYRRAA